MKIDSLKKLGEFLGQDISDLEPISKIYVDSRKVEKGGLYCALPGSYVHGEDFVKNSFENGAVAALVSHSYAGPIYGKTIFVQDVLKTLQMLAKSILKQSKPKYIVGVTGSLGKTTVKEFISTLLADSYTVYKTPGNANSQIGLPLAILNGFDNQEVVILEMGMTHPGQIKSLIEIAPPDIALITKIALVHAENFSSIEEIENAKAEIFLSPATQYGIFPKESLRLKQKGFCMKKTFSLDHSEADFCLIKKDHWVLKVEGVEYSLNELKFTEPHLLHNLLAAISVAWILKIKVQEICKQLKNLTLLEMRMQKIKKKGVLFINDSYNAAPDSMIAALRSLGAPEKGKKKIAVLGEMKELGQFSEDSHRSVGIEALSLIDYLICYGKNWGLVADIWKSSGKPCVLYDDKEKLIEHLKQLAEPGDIVLIKGSNSMKMWTIMDKFTV